MKKSSVLSVFITILFLVPALLVCQVPGFQISYKTGQQAVPAPLAPGSMLYEQNSSPSNEGGIASQDFTDFPDYACQAADDFTVPAGEMWTIDEIFCSGAYSTGGGMATMSHLFIYANDPTLNKPGWTIVSYPDHAVASTTGGNLTFSLATDPVVLFPGHYWISVQPHMAGIPYGQWYWKKQESPTILTQLHWRNPGGGFGVPNSQIWLPGSLVYAGSDHNLSFGLYGLAHDIVTVTESDSGETINLLTTDVLEIQLPVNPSTGYGWYVTNMNTGVIAQSGNWEFSPDTAGLVAGHPGTEHIRFTGVSQGTSALSLGLKRPWESGVLPVDNFSITVVSTGPYTGSYKPVKQPPEKHVTSTPKSLPSSFTWRPQCTPIKDQGDCGSCWAFASTGVFEANINITDQVITSLSEQYLINCATSIGNGCQGGSCPNQFWASPGSVYSSELPYANYDCFSYPSTSPRDESRPCIGTCGTYTYHEFIDFSINAGSTDAAIKQAIFSYGPVWASVFAGDDFENYQYQQGVIFNSTENGVPNHAVVLVGWDDNNGNGYWILRNSWGTTWGDAGYMHIGYGVGSVGYAANSIVYKGGIAAADLWAKDYPDDVGDEPNLITSPNNLYLSEDIWVRNIYPDGSVWPQAHQLHENPQYRSSPIYWDWPNVQIRNLGSQPSTTGAFEVTLYWAKADPALSWPSPWTGGVYYNGASPPLLMGDIIYGPIALPSIPPYGSYYLGGGGLGWQPPNPIDYLPYYGTDMTHFYLLARIEEVGAPNGGMFRPEDAMLALNVRFNNNIVCKDITILPEPVTLDVNSTPIPCTSVNVTVSPPDNNGYSNGVTSFTRDYYNGQTITLTAAPVCGISGPVCFNYWLIDGTTRDYANPVTFKITSDVTYTAVYSADLYIKDIPADIGYEPDPVDYWNLVNGDDIWIRNRQDTPDPNPNYTTPRYMHENQHESPEYDPLWAIGVHLPHIYVKVRNRLCTTVSGYVHIYYNRLATSDEWNACNSNGLCGAWQELFCDDINGNGIIDLMETNDCPANQVLLAPGQEWVVEMPWQIARHFPNPDDLGARQDYCLLARFVSVEDPMTNEVNMVHAAINAKENNNIVQKNVEVVNDKSGKSYGYFVDFGNVTAERTVNRLDFIEMTPYPFSGLNGKVTVDLGDTLYNAWATGGKAGSGILEGTDPSYPYVIELTGDTAFIGNIKLNPHDLQTMVVKYNYYPGDSSTTPFEYQLRQFESTDTINPDYSYTGAVIFYIHKPYCPDVSAGSDAEICPGQSAVLSGSPVTEDAEYEWRNSLTGQLAGTGASINVSPSETTSYILTITAPNGCTGSDEVIVSVNPQLPIVTPFSEGFETTAFPPGCWTNTAVSGSFLWARTSGASGNGTGSASALADFFNQAAGVYELKTPVFSIGSLALPVLRFNYAYATYVAEVDRLIIYHSTDNGATWSILLDMPGGINGILNTGGAVLDPFIPEASQWGTQTISLPAGCNRLKFRAVSAYGNNLYLDNIMVMDNSPLAVNLVNLGNAMCFGTATGFIDIAVSGGTPPFNYLWSNGAITQDIQGLVAGFYTVTVTDAGSSNATDSYVVSEPPLLAVTGIVTDASCYGNNDGSINITVTGGTLPYSFQWSNPPGTVNEDISGLSAGAYTVTVTDGHSCATTGSWMVGQPSDLELSAIITSVSCPGGADGCIDLVVTGGVPLYDYSWSTMAMTEDICDLAAGTYTVTVTDSHNCTKTASWEVQQPDVIAWQGVSTDVTCFGKCDGTITTLSTTGGTPQYTYTWSNFDNGPDIDDLCPGTYSVLITDANLCTEVFFMSISEPAQLMLSAVTTPESCAGAADGTIDLAVTGGVWSYTYQWNDLNNSQAEDLANLPAGTYCVTVTDLNLCVVTGCWTVGQQKSVCDNLILQNKVVEDTRCYSATQTITVAGDGTTFTVMNSGNVTLISGVHIVIRPITVVQPGGTLHAIIAPGGPWCGEKSASVVIAPGMIATSQSGSGITQVAGKPFFTIYPNPTTGGFSLETKGFDESAELRIEMYDVLGECVLSGKLQGQNKYDLSLGGKPNGVYFLRVVCGNFSGSRKVIKK